MDYRTNQPSITCDHCGEHFKRYDNFDAPLMNRGNYDCCMVCFNYTGPGCIDPGVKAGLRRTTVIDRFEAAQDGPAEGPPTGQQGVLQTLLHRLATAANARGDVVRLVPANTGPDADGRQLLGPIEVSTNAPPEFLEMLERTHGPLVPVGQRVNAGPVQVATGVPVAVAAAPPPPPPAPVRRAANGGRIVNCLNCQREYGELMRTMDTYCSPVCQNTHRATWRPADFGEDDDEESDDAENM